MDRKIISVFRSLRVLYNDKFKLVYSEKSIKFNPERFKFIRHVTLERVDSYVKASFEINYNALDLPLDVVNALGQTLAENGNTEFVITDSEVMSVVVTSNPDNDMESYAVFLFMLIKDTNDTMEIMLSTI